MSGSKTSTTRAIRARRLLLLVCLLGVLLVPAAAAAPGTLDPSFGTGGLVTTAISANPASDDYANTLARQPDGKLVVAGNAYSNATGYDVALARYNADGSLDASFNGTGKVTTAIGSGFSVDAAEDVALQPDGKIVAAGYSHNGFNYDFALVRYNPDGSLDTSFNGTGKVTTPFAAYDDLAYAVAIQPDGKIVAAGSSYNGSDDDFALARYNPDGSLDTSFNGTGKVTTAIGTKDEVYALALQPDGKLVAAGGSYNPGQSEFALARYNADGSLDSSFDLDGKVTTAIGGYSSANSLALQPDGKLVAAGVGDNGSQFAFALARYNANGSLDTNFNGSGKVTTAIGSVQDGAAALARQPDGKLVAAGLSYNGSTDDFALARYNPDGSLDPAFGSGGKLTTAIGSGKDEAYGLALQPDGKLVAAGSSYNGSKNVFALVRYQGSSLTVTRTGSGSGSVTSSPNGINCGSTCSAPFAAMPVTLTATPAAGSSFAGWSGACSGTGTCTVSMSTDRTVTARFESNKTLTLTKAGSGTGTVTSSPAGISCGAGCAHSFTYGSSVTLTAAAAAGSSFAGWSGGGCSGTSTCTVKLDANTTVTATFALAVPPKPQCVVPKVKGKRLKAAKKAIKQAHCSVGRVTRAFSATVKQGHEIGQKPRAGRKLAPGSKVRLKISKGKKA
jgi:uncharacterized delta-60 repeat protein